MDSSWFRKITLDGLWRNNPGLVQLLGLCPILAVSTTLVNAVSLGLATTLVMAIANLAVSSLRSHIRHELRIPLFMFLIASLVAVVDLLFNAYLHALYRVLGIFIPLIATNCIVLARVEAFAARQTPLASTLDAVMMGLGLVWVLALLGGLRELLGNGTLFAGIDMVFPGLSAWQVLSPDYPGFLIALLPPGAFFALASLIAVYNALNQYWAQRRLAAGPAVSTPTQAVTPDAG